MKKAIGSVFIALVPLLGIALAQRPLLVMQSRFHEAKKQYHLALEANRSQLSQLGQKLQNNPALAENLNQQLYAVASRILSGYTISGKVDQLAILDEKCQFVANSEQGMLLTSKCPLTQFKNMESPKFQWRTLNQLPALEFVAPLGSFGERSYYLLASAKINSQWIFQFPLLASLTEDLELNFGDVSPGTSSIKVVEEGKSHENLMIANLTTRHFLPKIYPEILLEDPATLKNPLLFALLILAATLINLWRKGQLQLQKVQTALTELDQWSAELLPEGIPRGTAKASETWDINTFRERINQILRKNYEQLQKNSQHTHSLEQQIVSLETRITEQLSEQLWLEKAQSLHQQMNQSAVSHLQKLQDMHSLGEDLSHLSAWKLAKPAEQIHAIGIAWQSELEKISARKLVRSMAERIDASGTSELEHTVNFIVRIGRDLANSAINVTVLSQKLLVLLQENIGLASHWHQLMGAQAKGQRPLLALLLESQTLIKLQENDLNLEYENQLAETLRIDHLKIPESTLTSALYHGQMALFELARSRFLTEAKLINQYKKRGEKDFLVLSLKANADDDLFDTHLPPMAEEHFFLANQLLQKYPIQMTRLPGLQGVQALAVSWIEFKVEKDLRDFGPNL